jgi:hypothetical protein
MLLSKSCDLDVLVWLTASMHADHLVRIVDMVQKRTPREAPIAARGMCGRGIMSLFGSQDLLPEPVMAAPHGHSGTGRQGGCHS